MNSQLPYLLSSWSDKIPDSANFILQATLEKVPEDKLGSLAIIHLKDPVIGLVLGLFFGYWGVDRFYKGDIGLGIAKLLLCWATLFLWYIIDLYFVYKGIKEDNLQKIMQAAYYLK